MRYFTAVWMTLLLCLASSSFGAESLEHDGWRPYSPREELSPSFTVQPKAGLEGEAALAIEHDEREALDGAWHRVFEVSGGQHYKLSAAAKLDEVENPRKQVYAEVWFHDGQENVVRYEAGDQSRPYFAAEKGIGPDGWTRFEGIFPAPKSATHATVKLHLRWAPGSRVLWSAPELTPADPPPARKVRLAAINHRPRGTKTALENLQQMEAYIAQASQQKADLAVMGECITTVGNSLSHMEAAEAVPGPSTEYLGTLAKKHGLYLVTSLFEREGHKIYNTAVLLGPDGELVGKYRKVCLARDEYRKGIAPGDSFPVFDTQLGKIGMMICFDVHMPEAARGLAAGGAEIVAMPIMGGDPDLCKARCIENQVYMVTSTYDINDDWMQSGVWNLQGNLVARATEHDEVVVAEIDLAEPYLWRANMGQFRPRLRHERPGAVLPE